MANFKSDAIVTKEQLAPSNQAEAGNLTGKLPLIQLAGYTLLGTEVTNDTIQVFDLPVGCVIIPQLCSVTSADPGTTLTLDIGDALDTNRYADNIVQSNGGEVKFGSGGLPAAVLVPYLSPSTSRVYATVKSAAGITAGIKLNFCLAYRIKG